MRKVQTFIPPCNVGATILRDHMTRLLSHMTIFGDHLTWVLGHMTILGDHMTGHMGGFSATIGECDVEVCVRRAEATQKLFDTIQHR